MNSLKAELRQFASNTKPYGPWDKTLTREFLVSAVGSNEDSVNHRFDFDTVAEKFAGKRFDAAQMWMELESFRLNKWNARSYNA